MDALNSEHVMSEALMTTNQSLASILNAEIVALKSPMRPPIDEIMRATLENLKGGSLYQKIVVLLETPGGFIEVVERITIALRYNFASVEFIVPNYAYSAGTVLVMSGDEIHMDYFSVLGPIDPQHQTEDGSYVPGMGYLAKFNELIQLVNKDPDGSSTRAEMALLLKKFDPAKLFHIEHAIEHSKSLLMDWLPKYKFKDWKLRETSGETVTDEDRKERARQIAEVLGDAERWHSHGRGITIRELQSDAIKLKVSDFELNDPLRRAVWDYHSLFVDYMHKRSMQGAIHSRCGMRGL